MPDLIRVTQPYSWSVAISRSPLPRPSPRARPRPRSASVSARTCAAEPPRPRVLDVAHEDHAAEPVVARPAPPTATGGVGEVDRGHQDLADEVGVGEPGHDRGRLRRRVGRRLVRARGRGELASWCSPVVVAEHPASRRRDTRPGRRAHRNTGRPAAEARRAPVNHRTHRTFTHRATRPARQLTWVSQVGGRPLAGVPVRLELGVPGRAEQPVAARGRSPRCRGRWRARRGPGPR